MKSADIRQAFLDYFAQQGHTVVASSSLVPADDPTLLFTNAGMNQFKDVFLGRDKRDYQRAVSSQRCVRAGGKHNDLENVGYTARHHTFFEMLGNFSFGDYFKEEAIRFAWEFLTSEQWMNIAADKLTVTVYADDNEAYALWADHIGVPAERIIRIGDNKGAPFASDNFWQMGDTGPCGPCTEIFYDHGADIWGGPPGSAEEDGDRFIEIWNLVFMQYDRQPNGEMKPLPKPSVDTGMGLERIAAVLQQVHSNYEIDLFQALLKAAAEATGCNDLSEKSLRVIADHIRSASFLICDGVIPSNEGRGYVLRRIIRRALRHGHKLGQSEPFFYSLTAALVAEMGDAYPELRRAQGRIEKALLAEEVQFARTLADGMKVFEQAVARLSGDVIPGDIVFTLYDTHGFPVDLTNDVARERGLTLDMDGFDACMARQRDRSRGADTFASDYHDRLQVDAVSTFCGYQQLDERAEVVALYRDGEAVSVLDSGEQGMVVLSATPFYAESGGQVGDSGVLDNESSRFIVADTRKRQQAHLHIGVLEQGTLKMGDHLQARVDSARRRAIMRNHSATHLLHAALRQVLGEHVMQKGSLVNADYLRFDFSHGEAIGAGQLAAIEALVNQQVLANVPVTTELMDMESARRAGAMALFGEKYHDEVRVLTMGENGFSKELCGGTHVARTGDIGLFRIVSEGASSAGVRRLEAVTGENAWRDVQRLAQLLQDSATLLKTAPDQLPERLVQLVTRSRELEKEVERLKQKLASGSGNDLASQVRQVNGVKMLAAQLDGADSKALRNAMDQLKNKLGSAVIVLTAVEGDKISVVAGVTADLTTRFHAGELVRHVSGQLGGKGGGRADMAQGGGSDAAALATALASVDQWLRER